MKDQNSPISDFMLKHFKHFNSAALVDAAQAYRDQLDKDNKMMVTLAGAMCKAELGKSLAEMIRQDKVHIISCTGANLEEDLMNLVAHKHYKRNPNRKGISPTSICTSYSALEYWNNTTRSIRQTAGCCPPPKRICL